ncbi:NAD(P)H-binding protein [Acetobacter sp. LMG 32666]|uniref:NmrA family NAD(P)-binding protein n=1 Tax=Acetobacter sp. LMG 32666 TaxID=2959295 RepID=UPI0030C89C1E
MDVVLGANGHVGAAVAQTLLARGRAVTVALRSPTQAPTWEQRGATVAIVDVCNTPALATLLGQAHRAFVLNPPASPALDTDKVERASAHAIVAALQKVTLEKIVVQSTYGAQPGAHCADLGVLYELEQAVQALATPCCIVRAAYYMSNWLPLMATARTTGLLPSLVPAHQRVPMVAPQDVGQLGAHLLAAPITETGLYAIEGPTPYSPTDVAACLNAAPNPPVTVQSIPKSDWENYYLANGFSHMAARSYATMTAIFTDQTYNCPQHPHKGATDLATYFAQALLPNA